MSHHIVLIHSPVERYSGCSYTKATVNNAAMNMGIQISLWGNYFISFDYISRSGIMDHIRVLLNFLRNLHNKFPWELLRYTSLPTVHKHSFFSSASITFVISYLLVLAFQKGMRWYLLCFWSAFPLLISDAEHLVIYLLIICMSYLWENVYSLKMEHTSCLLYSNIRNSVVDVYIDNKLSESGIKKTIHLLLHHKKIKQ